MQVVVATESRFDLGDDGVAWCPSGTFDYQFWRRYLDVFEHVTVVARCHRTGQPQGRRVSGPGVQVWPLVNAHGAWGALRRWRSWHRALQPLLRESTAWILRVPGQIGGILTGPLVQQGIPFGIEVVGDPATAFDRHSFRHPLRPWIRLLFQRWLTRACQRAVAAAYVTRHYLQQRYPAGPSAYTTDYSSVELPAAAFVDAPRDGSRATLPRLVSVATMSQRYKGHQHLIDAVGHCRDWGHTVHLRLVGDGRLRGEFEAQVASRGLSGQVEFVGQRSAGPDVWRELDQADLFVLASVGAEGLPRAMIEAQARALPCVGTRVCGIPELLNADELANPGDSVDLARVILRTLRDAKHLRQLSRQNLERSHRYGDEELQQRRRAFYQRVQDATVHQVVGATMAARKVA